MKPDTNREKSLRLFSLALIAMLVLFSSVVSYKQHKEKKTAHMQTAAPLPVQTDLSSEPPLLPSDEPVSGSDAVSPTDTHPDGVSDVPSVQPAQPERPLEETVKIKYIRITVAANVRKDKSAGSDKLTTLQKGAEVEYVSESGDRYQIRFGGSTLGWIPKKYGELLEKEVVIRHIAVFTGGDPIDMKDTKEGDTIGRILKNHATMGASVAVIRNGQVAYHYEYGYADKEKKKTVNENTKFRIASVTKVFTAMMAMRQVDDGLLDLDKDLSDYLGFKVRNPSYKQAITMRMLLTHTSGLVDHEEDMYSKGIRNVLSQKDFYNGPPGQNFLYSNLGMGVAGAVMEKTSKQCISEYAQAAFFKPMGIDAAFDAKYLSDKSQIANCYLGTQINRSSKYLARPQAVGKPGATYHLTAGGLLISGKDLAKVFTLLLNNGQYDGKTYLSRTALDEMMKTQLVPKGKNFNQCLGLRQKDKLLGNRNFYYHNGIAYGVYSLMAIDPSDKSGIVVITSGADGKRNENTLFAVCEDVMTYCYSEEFPS